VTTALWTAAEAAAATGGRTGRSWSVSGVSIDSRTVAAGDLFIALAGPSFDGHDFAAAALAQGAAAAMVARIPAGLTVDGPLLVVDDTLAALGRLGAASRARSPARIAAVTGSAGKTSTKEALRWVLSRQGLTAASAASHNNHWGVPLSLSRMPREAAFGVFEIGTNHVGEIAPLSRLVRPHVAIVTTVAEAHIEFFASIEAIADEKADIMVGMDAAGAVVLNRDNAMFERLAASARARGIGRVVGFGRHPAAEARVIDHRADGAGSLISAEIGGLNVVYRLPVPGTHWVSNSLAVLAAVQALGGDVAAAAASFGDLPALDGRGRHHRVRLGRGTVTVIDESYNANPASMRAAFETLSCATPAAGGRRVAVLGDMLELGWRSAELHAALAEPLAGLPIERVHCAGAAMRHLYDKLPEAVRGAWGERSDAIVAAVVDDLRDGDVVMIKGSLGSRMKVVLEALLARGGAPSSANAA
jgi:UDP-N-acetylmuramoyl-tripeptide--D-alanyl-D-alanine ligase